jgi:hypothetical protein
MNIHVVPREDGWAVVEEGSPYDSANTDTRESAIRVGRQLAKIRQSILVIHDDNGHIREKLSFSLAGLPRKVAV